jgi:hypothetical protein
LIDRVPSFYNENRVFPYFLKVPMESLAWRLSGNSPKPSTTRYSHLAKQVVELHAAGGLLSLHTKSRSSPVSRKPEGFAMSRVNK